MKKVLIICFLAGMALAWGLEFIDNEINVNLPVIRNDIAAYHTWTDDRHYYYSYEEAEDHRWAVKYDFRTYYGSADSTRFAPDSVMIYLPDMPSGSGITLGLYDDGEITPGELVTETSIPANDLETGWNVVPLNAPADSVYWLVADYLTNETHTISASNGDGSHSYYWDPEYGNDGSWRNMSGNGFHSEFLFGLTGEFYLNVIDLEISDFEISGNIEPGNEVQLSALLTNNSSEDVTDVEVIFQLIFPGYNLADTVNVESISSGSSLEIEPSGSPAFILYSDPGRCLFYATLHHEEDEISSNNEAEIIENIFEYEREMQLIENMVELDNIYSEGIWEDQISIADANEVVNFFPVLGDEEYFCFEAGERYSYYDLYNLPATVVDGDAIVGYESSNYLNVLNEKLESSEDEKTFIRMTSVTADVDTLNEVHVSVTLERGAHRLSADYLINCQIMGFIIEKDLPLTDNINGTVFLDTLEFASPAINALANADTLIKTTTFNKFYKFAPLHEDIFDFCYLLFFIQNKDSNKIWEAYEMPFSDFGVVDNEENEIVTYSNYRLYPNPMHSGNFLNIVSDQRDVEIEQIGIYNLKGQKIITLSSGRSVWDGRNETGKLAGSGIYFVKIKDSKNTTWLKTAVVK